MASIFGRRQKPTPSKKEAPVSNGNQNGVEAFMAADIMENGTKGVNGSESDYHKNGRHSSTFKPQIPPTSSTNSSPFLEINVLDDAKFLRIIKEINFNDLTQISITCPACYTSNDCKHISQFL